MALYLGLGLGLQPQVNTGGPVGPPAPAFDDWHLRDGGGIIWGTATQNAIATWQRANFGTLDWVSSTALTSANGDTWNIWNTGTNSSNTGPNTPAGTAGVIDPYMLYEGSGGHSTAADANIRIDGGTDANSRVREWLALETGARNIELIYNYSGADASRRLLVLSNSASGTTNEGEAPSTAFVSTSVPQPVGSPMVLGDGTTTQTIHPGGFISVVVPIATATALNFVEIDPAIVGSTFSNDVCIYDIILRVGGGATGAFGPGFDQDQFN